MSARPEPVPLTETDDFIRACEHNALRRLAKLTESENERVALRACEVLLRYARERRRADEPQRPKADPKPPVPGAKIPPALVHPPVAKPAFRAVPLDALAALGHGNSPNATSEPALSSAGMR